jgi:hypothetical protein
MTDDRRHHVATRREIIFVEVPVAGTVKETHRAKPPAYRHSQHQPWRPAHDIPVTRPPTKAQRLGEFMRRVQQQTEDAREVMRHAREVSQRRDEVIPSA